MFGRQEDCDSTRNYVCFQNRDQELNGSIESIGGQTVPVPEVGLSGMQDQWGKSSVPTVSWLVLSVQNCFYRTAVCEYQCRTKTVCQYPTAQTHVLMYADDTTTFVRTPTTLCKYYTSCTVPVTYSTGEMYYTVDTPLSPFLILLLAKRRRNLLSSKQTFKRTNASAESQNTELFF